MAAKNRLIEATEQQNPLVSTAGAESSTSISPDALVLDALVEKLERARQEFIEGVSEKDESAGTGSDRFDTIIQRLILKLRSLTREGAMSSEPQAGEAIEPRRPEDLVDTTPGSTTMNAENAETDALDATDTDQRTSARCRAMGIVIPDRQSFKMGEVGQILEVDPYVIRYWLIEFQPWLKFRYSSVRLRLRSRRYRGPSFCREDVERLADIRYLLWEDKYTIAGTKKVLRREAKERGTSHES